ncbi:MAG: hypothetical protein HC890_05730 [Chloroflexaceae bacterium]|nr:hypothetical protein [Chloroflexaceae bacterium]
METLLERLATNIETLNRDLREEINAVKHSMVAIQQDNAEIKRDVEDLKKISEKIEKRIDSVEGRLFDLSLRSMAANSSAFFSLGIAVLSAVIAYVVATVSQKSL